MISNVILVLLQLKGISRKTVYKSFDVQNTPYSIAELNALIKNASFKDKRITIPTATELNQAIDKAKKIEEDSQREKIQIIDFLDSNFPQKLKDISDPPAIIYAKGDIDCINKWSVAVIGTREPTEYGIKIAENLGYVLGRDGYTVVSGLAYGCDKLGHCGCLKAGGKTVAVMAGGLEKIYPAKHEELSKEIISSGGCLISEYPVGTRTFQNFFVERDRLQSGISDGVIVIETDIKGGTMHTVGYAKEYNKVLACFAHPSKYLNEKKTLGNQKLIQDGIAFSLRDNNDLCKFKEMVKMKYYGLENNQIKKNDKCQVEQMNLFEFM